MIVIRTRHNDQVGLQSLYVLPLLNLGSRRTFVYDEVYQSLLDEFLMQCLHHIFKKSTGFFNEGGLPKAGDETENDATRYSRERCQRQRSMIFGALDDLLKQTQGMKGFDRLDFENVAELPKGRQTHAGSNWNGFRKSVDRRTLRGIPR